jgi:indolepyruvate ferredoxin oxidoreductase beta subunit
MPRKQPDNILIVGVGGQGILLASELLCEVAFLSGRDVKKSEVHGMAQRGGVVSSHVRIGDKIYSPLIPTGQADVLLSFEQAESKRWIHFVRSGGQVIVNTRKLIPPVAFMRSMRYPEDPIGELRSRQQNIIPVSATEMAESLGNIRVANIILLGVLSRFLQLPLESWEQGIRKRVPRGTEAVNLKAFHAGRSIDS